MFYMFILPSINFHLPYNSSNPKREREPQKLPPSLRPPSLCMLHLSSLVFASEGNLLLSFVSHSHLSLFLSLSLQPTKARSNTACHRSSAFTQESHPLFHSLSRHSRSGLVLPSLSSSLLSGKVKPSWLLRNKPQVTPLHGGLLLFISLFLSNSNQTPQAPHLFLCLIFCFFDL